MVVELDDKSFSSKVENAKGGILVDFWAPWCGPCKMMAPVFDELSKQYDDITFAKVNVDEYGDIAGKYDVRGIPTLIFFKDGKEVNRITGFAPKDRLSEEILNTF
ncbi:MAG TPA: thioredoxin [Acidobacteriota bacterium]|nr:thioredoxin [Acidobacteriota bacterium]